MYYFSSFTFKFYNTYFLFSLIVLEKLLSSTTDHYDALILIIENVVFVHMTAWM